MNSNKIMYTDSSGISYYRRSNKYFFNTGWFEREITKKEFLKHYGREAQD